MQGSCSKVIVVEDDFLLRMDVTLYLEDEGLDVIAAGNADEALSLLPEEQPVSILFTDIEMPGTIDGLALAAAVASRWPDTKVIIASAVDVMPQDMPPKARFVPKPYRPADVIRTIDELCN